jgi:acetyl-CoA carboxylase carboxyltransferase component
MVGKSAEAGGIAKNGAKMVMAVANAKVGRVRL